MQTIPRLSLIICARNDRHMGNFRWRFETALNYLAANLEHLGRLNEVEVVVTDWSSEVPLHAVLSLNSPAKQILRFILVPLALAQELQGDSKFPIVLAQNIAVRRSRGEYIAQTDSDILFTLEFLKKLFEILDGHRTIGVPLDGSLLVSKRRKVPWWYVIRQPKISELDWFIQRFEDVFQLADMFFVDNLGIYTATGFVLMHRELWEEFQGYDERLVHMGWMDVDLVLRVTRKYPWIYLEKAGLPEVFHMEHDSPWIFGRRTRKRNPEIQNNSYSPNDKNWGLAIHPLEIFVYPNVATDVEELTDTELRPSDSNYAHFLLTAQVYLWRGLRCVKHAMSVFLHRLLPGRLHSFLSLWINRAITLWCTILGQPINRWPSLIHKRWVNRQVKSWWPKNYPGKEQTKRYE